ncbi:TPA: hypothetical protein ACXHSK_005232 [Klebsiella pneumoniae]
MSSGKSIPVWFAEEDRRRVEEAATLAGYKHLSKYIRDRVFDRGDAREGSHDSMEAWAERQEVLGRLEALERGQKEVAAMLSMLVFFARKNTTTGVFNELILACEKSHGTTDFLAESVPEIHDLLRRFRGEG